MGKQFDLIIIGAGPGGYVAAKKAAKLEMCIRDRERRYYYESNTGEEWGKSGTYQVILNVSRTGIEKAVDMLAALFNGLCD